MTRRSTGLDYSSFAVDSQGNPAHAWLGNRVVWNDDEIAAHSGFPMHGHRDIEIVTYVHEGVLKHEDSSGGRGEIRAGNVQAIGIAIAGEPGIAITAIEPAEIILVDTA